MVERIDEKAERECERKYKIVLESIDENISDEDITKKYNVSLTTLRRWKRIHRDIGRDGLYSKSRRPKNIRYSTSEDIRKQIINSSLENPSSGYKNLYTSFFIDHDTITEELVKRTMKQEGLNNEESRWIKLENREEKKRKFERFKLTKKQIEFIEKKNPCFKDRYYNRRGCGKIVHLFKSEFKGLQIQRSDEKEDIVYLYAVIDTCSNYAICRFNLIEHPAEANNLLYNEAYPVYKDSGSLINRVLANTKYKRRLSASLGEIDYDESWKEFYNLEEEDKIPKTNGFKDRFRKKVNDEFINGKMKSFDDVSIEKLNDLFSQWLKEYNDNPIQGFPNYGRSPEEIFF